MEGVLCKTSSSDIQNNAINLRVDAEVFESNVILPSRDLLLDEDRNSETKQAVNGFVENGSKTPTNGETVSATDCTVPKTFSPTLLESAFKVMKNLFSPDKSKNKSATASSPIIQQKSSSISPSTSIYIQGKSDIFSSEPGIEILNNIQSLSAENNLKNQPETGGVQSSLNFDLHNNTDDSFLTTASLIDDSFHSAVTHLDEHAEALKNGIQVIGSALNNSQNLDVVDPYNDTLINNDSYLDNTTLKIDNAEASIETLDCTKISGLSDTSHQLNYSGESQEKNSEESNSENHIKDTGEKDKSLKNCQVSPSLNGTDKDEVKQTENKEMANIFLNNSFQEESLPQKESKNEITVKPSELQFENTIDEQDGYVDNSISTTTVVLNSVNSGEIDNMLMSLRVNDSDGLTPSFASLGGSDDPTGSVENLTEKFLPTHPGLSLPVKSSLDSSSTSVLNFPKEQREKKCASEGNSPTHGSRPTSLKLNKSDELINRRIASEPLDGKNVQEKKSSVDISLMKNSEASEITKESHPFAKVTESVKEIQSEIGESNLSSATSQPIPVISQLSYTILSHDNSLTRPVIESVNVSAEVCEKETFQPMGRLSVESEKDDKSSGKNLSFGTEDLVKSQIKQSTPLWEGVNEGAQKFFRPTPLKFYSPEQPEVPEISEGKNALSNSGSQSPSNATQVLSNKTPAELSPVNPVNDLTYLYVNQFSNTVPHEKDGSGSSEQSPQPEGFDIKEGKLNQTYDKGNVKIGESPASQNLQQTFQKKLDKHDKTFEKKSTNLNTTFTRKRESEGKGDSTLESASPEAGHMNKTYDKPLSQLNETYEKKPDPANATHVIESPGRSETFTFESNRTFEKITEIPENLKPEEPMKTEAEEANKMEAANGENESFSSAKSSSNSLSAVPSNEEDLAGNSSIDDLSRNLEKMILEEKHGAEGLLGPLPEGFSSNAQAEEKLLNSFKDDKCDADLVQLIQEQFSPNDIEKICSVVQDMSSVKLSSDILRASELFDKSFHGNFSDADFKPPEMVLKSEKVENPLSPQGFDFLSSIRGKPTGRDLSRESLYVKFDPLVQPSANSLIDFTKEGEALPVVDDSPPAPHNTSICEQLLAISPEKKPNEIVPPLTPLSSKVKADSEEKLKELQNEIYFLRNLYAEREKSNKAKMEEYENQVAKLTGESCFLEDKLKESNEREKSLVKKMKEQNQNIGNLKIIMEEYVKVISKLTAELETLKKENEKQIESLSTEKDSYMTHLQNTEAAFTDVHTKYEKSKKTILSLKTNEEKYRNTIAEQSHKMEELKLKAKEAQEKALADFQRIQEELNETKSSHSQETARLRAQLRKTELKVEALKESLDQKIKENQQLTAICDELIEGKK